MNELVNLEAVDISLESERDYCYWYELLDAACNEWPFIPLDTAKRMNLTMTANLQDENLRETLSGPRPVLTEMPGRTLSTVSEGQERNMLRLHSVDSERLYSDHEDNKREEFSEKAHKDSKKRSMKDKVVSFVSKKSEKERKERVNSSSSNSSDINGELSLPHSLVAQELDDLSITGAEMNRLQSREIAHHSNSLDQLTGHYDQFHDHHNPQKNLDAPHYQQQPTLEEGVVKEGLVTKFPKNNKTGSPKERYLVLTYYRDTGGTLTYYEKKGDFDRSRSPKGRLHLTGQVTVDVSFKNHRRVCKVMAEIRKDGEQPEEADRYMRTDSVARRSSTSNMMDKLKHLVPQEGMVFESFVFFTDGEETEDWARKISRVLQVMGSEDSD